MQYPEGTKLNSDDFLITYTSTHIFLRNSITSKDFGKPGVEAGWSKLLFFPIEFTEDSFGMLDLTNDFLALGDYSNQSTHSFFSLQSGQDTSNHMLILAYKPNEAVFSVLAFAINPKQGSTQNPRKMDYFGFTKVPTPGITLENAIPTLGYVHQQADKIYLIIYRLALNFEVIVCLIDYPSTGDSNSCEKSSTVLLPSV